MSSKYKRSATNKNSVDHIIAHLSNLPAKGSYGRKADLRRRRSATAAHLPERMFDQAPNLELGRRSRWTDS